MRITETMLRVLGYADSGAPLTTGCAGRSQFGGRATVIRALHARGYLDNNALTSAGREVLERGQRMRREATQQR